MNSDIFADFLHQYFSDSITTSLFPYNLKNTNITPVFKKGDRNSETNYRPVSMSSSPKHKGTKSKHMKLYNYKQ